MSPVLPTAYSMRSEPTGLPSASRRFGSSSRSKKSLPTYSASSLDGVDHRVVDGRPARLARLDLDPADVAVLGQAGVGDEVDEQIRAFGRHDHVLLHLDDEVRFAVLPSFAVRPLERRRQIRGIAARGASVDPGGDQGDLLVGEARVRLVDADRPVDVPGRHLAGGDPALDRARPGPGLLVGKERHRRRSSRPVAAFARALEDRCDVAAPGHVDLGLRVAVAVRGFRRFRGARRQGDQRDDRVHRRSRPRRKERRVVG